MLMVATDGIATAENPELPAPIETGTQTVHNKPLGGWEHKDAKHGMFFARPGIYFPLKATADDMDSFRARGIGRKELYGQWSEIMRAFRNGDDVIHLGNGVRFHGAKSSIHLRRGDDGKPEAIRSERYGQWKPRPIKMSFNPMPKRDSVMKGNGLRLREFSQSLESLPYMRALLSPDAVLLKLAEQIAFEQPQ